MSTSKIGDLELQIEELVREHVAALRRTATAALERAFGQAAGGKTKGGRPTSMVREVGKRRGPEEMMALGERLYAAICLQPGAPMTKLAAELGATSRELNRPVTQLRRTGRVRSVGQRHTTRYFPMSAKTATRS